MENGTEIHHSVSSAIYIVSGSIIKQKFDLSLTIICYFVLQEEWSWLRHFFYESVAKDMEGKVNIIHIFSNTQDYFDEDTYILKDVFI